MIGSLQGTVAAVGEESALIEVGGVGYVVQASGRTLGRLSVGATVRLYIETHVREDAIKLFGFDAEEERADSHDRGMRARVPTDRGQGEVGDVLPPRIPVSFALGERMRDVLGEDAHRLGAFGRDAAVVGCLEIELGPEPVGQAAGARQTEDR